MKFGKTLTNLRVTDERYGHYYMQYGVLKSHLKTPQDSSTKEKEFVQLVDSELQRVQSIVSSKLSEMKVNCESLHIAFHTTIAGVEKLDANAQVKKLEDLAVVLGSELAAIERFIYYNQEGFCRILKQHDKITGTKSIWFETKHFPIFKEWKRGAESLLVSLSDFYHKVREINEKNDSGKETTVSADTFERKNSKYWVPIQDVFALKTKLAKHLPILLFNRKDHEKMTHTSVLLKRANITEFRADSGWISSVYFDNENLDCYRRRQEMEEGAALMRIRWYGDPDDSINNLTEIYIPRTYGSDLFMERKTHHESWIADSVKERFPIKAVDIYPYITGKTEVDEKVSGKKRLELAQETQNQIVKDSLQPFVRTVYRRAAFQRQETNDIRITLDTDLLFVNEFTGEALTSNNAESSKWKRREEDIEEKRDWIIFPHAILEVKLKVERPPWLDDILQLPFIREVQKFSKFQTGCASFYPSKVKKFPYWFDDEAIQEAYSEETAVKKNQDEEQKVSELKKNQATTSDDVCIGIDNEAFTDNKETVLYPMAIEEPNEKVRGLWGMKYNVLQVHKEPKNKTPAVSLKEKKHKRLGIFTKAKTSVNPRATKRLKVEPKTFFANERTFFQWITAATLLLTLGSALIDLGNSDSRMTGFFIIPIAFFVMIYATFMYYIRIYKIRNGKKRNYHDYFGPGMLVFFLISAMVATVLIPYRHLLNSPDDTRFNLTESKECHRIHVPGLSVFNEPSDLLLDSDEEQLWLVTGDCMLREMDIKSGNLTREIFVKDNNKTYCVFDIEALTWGVVSNESWIVYLGSEEPHLLVLEYDLKNEKILRKFDVAKVISHYDTQFFQLEGLHLIKGFPFGRPTGSEKLVGGGQFIAAGPKDIISFGIDESTDPPQIFRYQKIQFPDNLSKEKVGAIRFFDNHLFLVFDNEKIVLVMNVKSGQMWQYELPGNTKQWEGIELMRNMASENRIYMYLAMDTPGEIWRFEFEHNVGFLRC